MSDLTDLVPPLELCKLIPAGEFADSALVWRVPNSSFPLEDEFYEIHRRDKCESWMKDKQIPAPTLQEIMAEIAFAQVSIIANKSFVIHPRFGKNRYVRCSGNNGATAALKLWLKMKGIEA